MTFTTAGLFSGIGGLELPFARRGARTELLCENWEPARAVLAERFAEADLHGDVADLADLPRDVDVVTAGFPCTDLSQAGRTAGIRGRESGLVSHVFRLLRRSRTRWLVLENVRNMLVLDRGGAMAFLVEELEALGFAWAYRTVDSRFSGVPQRRHRVLFVASRTDDPRGVLFADEAGPPDAAAERDDAFGFYWTEGLRGLGWARNAVPPLKGGSGVGIPSPPGIWRPRAAPGRRVVTPSVEDAEALQGFPRGWTEAARDGRRDGARWKLVGNAVTVGVADWLASRLLTPGTVALPVRPLDRAGGWPEAAFGHAGGAFAVDASHWPRHGLRRHLSDVVQEATLTPLSHRAAAGFLSRARLGRLRFDPRFLADVEAHVAGSAPIATTAAE
ncbi:MAG: DNA (cytosine-5-)-methyltransferase [Paracoccaceae bacterium]